MIKEKIENLAYIDAIRGLAILMVMAHHAAQKGTIPMPHFLAVLLSLGTRGVQLFFIASAFTLYRSFRNRESSEKNVVANFFIRRYFRIAPMYYLVIFYYVCRILFSLPFWYGNQAYISLNNVLSNVFFLHGFNPFWINSLVPGGWSIAVEMLFYLVFPFVFRYIKSINSAIIFFIISMLFKIILQELLQSYPLIENSFLWREFLFYYFPAQLPIFSLGFILFFFIDGKNVFASIDKKILFLALLLLFVQMGTRFDFLYFNHLIFGIFFLFFVFCLSRGKLKWICNPLIRYIGKISFSLYIVHFIVIAWLEYLDLINLHPHYFVEFVLNFCLILAVSIFVSTITYFWIELPYQNLGKKIIGIKSTKR